jgi:hypothetical protein
MPERPVINAVWAAMSIRAGATALVTDAAKVRPAILATDLILGRDRFARRYIGDHRRREQEAQKAK